jgi:hypothetical protein
VNAAGSVPAGVSPSVQDLVDARDQYRHLRLYHHLTGTVSSHEALPQILPVRELVQAEPSLDRPIGLGHVAVLKIPFE